MTDNEYAPGIYIVRSNYCVPNELIVMEYSECGSWCGIGDESRWGSAEDEGEILCGPLDLKAIADDDTINIKEILKDFVVLIKPEGCEFPKALAKKRTRELFWEFLKNYKTATTSTNQPPENKP